MTNVWYEELSPDAPIRQGDLIENCPVLQWHNDSKTRQLASSTTGDLVELQEYLKVVSVDVVVLNQACDLNLGKVNQLLLCEYWPLSKHMNYFQERFFEQYSSKIKDHDKFESNLNNKWREYCNTIKNGSRWNLCMLNKEGKITDHMVVDFYKIYSIPKDWLEAYLQEVDMKRHSLLPPYRDYLSQSFARFFSRIGLPTDVDTSWSKEVIRVKKDMTGLKS